MNMSNHWSYNHLFFFDDNVKYPYLKKRFRKSTDDLPRNLQESRHNNKTDNISKLESFFQKQKGVYRHSSIELVNKKDIKRVDSSHSDIFDPQSISITNQKKKSSNRLIKLNTDNSFVNRNYFEQEYEDDSKFLYEEAKFSATNIILQLGKFLETLSCVSNNQSINIGVSEERKNTIFKEPDRDIFWQVNTFSSNVEHEKFQLNLPSFVVELLNESYEDLIAHASFTYREWQSQTYKDIFGLRTNSSIRHIDSGIFSVPQTAMSGLYTSSDDVRERKKSRAQRMNPSLSKLSSLQPKTSKDSGLTSGRTSENDSPQILCYKKESKLPKHHVAKPKTRFEKYCKNESRFQQGDGSFQKINITKTDQLIKEREDSSYHDEIPMPPLNQHMISFAISSKICHEKGWVAQPSSDDQEQHTLLAWARARLQQAISEKKKEEASSKYILKPTEAKIVYYGSTKSKSKLKKKKDKDEDTKEISKNIFTTKLTDGSFTVFYPSGNPAILTLQNNDTSNDFYTLIYDNIPGCELLGYFTPTGRGVCHLPNGKIGFLSAAKFGSCQDENGAIIKKWKWTSEKLVPPLCIQLNKHIVLRCLHKHAMFLVANINGESVKMKIGSSSEAKDPNLNDMGYLQTKHSFISSIAVQLTKSIPKKRDDKNKQKKEKLKLNPSSQSTLTDDQLEERLKNLEISFPNEMKGVQLNTPYQIELRQLQKKFKTTIVSWLEHYRLATGLSSPIKSKPDRKFKAKSAVLLSCKKGDLADLSLKKKTRAPSAPPMFVKGYKSQYTAQSSVVAYGDFDNITLQENEKNLKLKTMTPSNYLSRSVTSPTPSKHPPFRCGSALLNQSISANKIENFSTVACPLVIRSRLLGEDEYVCRCDKRKVTVLSDIEFDEFLKHLPKTQLLVVSIVSSSQSQSNSDSSILEKLYWQMNRNRTFPCMQSKRDPYRLAKYVAEGDLTEDVPMLVRRHNVLPGMFLMYEDRRLLFADYIFDGYGNSKKDFLKQISRTRKEALKGHSLPSDFRFSPSHCKGGQRTPWGGELGGLNNLDTIDNTPPFITKSINEIGESNTKEDLRGRTPTPDSQTSTIDLITPQISVNIQEVNESKKYMTTTLNETRRKSSVRPSLAR